MPLHKRFKQVDVSAIESGILVRALASGSSKLRERPITELVNQTDLAS